MSDLIPFDYSGRQVRTVQVDGEPWFVAADICTVLTLRDVSSALKMVDDEDRQRFRRSDTPQFFGGIAPQVQELWFVNESGLFALIFQSNKREARAFKSWVTHEVLPTIRRTGGYRLPATFSEALRELATKHEELEAAAPKVSAYDTYMDARNALAMGAVANQLGVGRNTMMRTLRDAGVLQKDNRPYQRHAHHFKVVAQTYEAQNETRATYTTYVFPSGVELIRRVLSGGKGLLSIPGGAA
jgi:anti-repressor protein